MKKKAKTKWEASSGEFEKWKSLQVFFFFFKDASEIW